LQACEFGTKIVRQNNSTLDKKIVSHVGMD